MADNIARAIAKKNKVDIENVIATFGSGSPKGVYATLAALETAFPTGTTGIYVVTADGKWYYWSGTAWTIGGTYQGTAIADSSVVVANNESAVRDIIRPTNVALALSFLNNKAKGSVNTIGNDIYKACVCYGDGTNIVVSGEKVICTAQTGTKFYISYNITTEMRKWNTISFGMNIASTSGSPLLKLAFFNVSNVEVSSVYAVATGTLFKYENLAIPATATYFTIYAQGTAITAEYTTPIVTYGGILGTYTLDYYNKIFITADKTLAKKNLLSTYPSLWGRYSITNSVNISSAYVSSTTRLAIKAENVINIDSSYTRLYWCIPSTMQIAIVQYDSTGAYISTSAFRTDSEADIAIASNCTKIVPLLAFQTNATIVTNDIKLAEIYLGYVRASEATMSTYDVRQSIKDNNTSITDHETRIAVLENEPTSTVTGNILGSGLKYIGHSGMTAYSTENTLEAYKASKMLGMWGAETDIRLTSDGEIVLMHDATVDRTTNGTGAVASLTLAEIKALNVNQTLFAYDVKVPTLTEFLICCKNNNLTPLIEIKYDEPDLDALTTKLLLDLQNNGMIDYSIIISFSTTVLNAVRAKNDDIWLSQILGSGAVIATADIDYAKTMGNFIIFSYNNYSVLTKAMIDSCYSNNIPVIYGTADTEVAVNKAIELGVNAIVTNKYYDLNKPSIKFTSEIRSTDSGTTWTSYGSTNSMTGVTFNTSLGSSKLGVTFDDVPTSWLYFFYPSISVTNYSGEDGLFINAYYDTANICIVLTFFVNGVKVNLGSLPAYVKFRVNVVF